MQSCLAKLLDQALAQELPFLLIGGHAVNLHGHSRLTFDVDLLIPNDTLDRWKPLLAGFAYGCLRETKAFAQFAAGPDDSRLDLMLVDESTFAKLMADSQPATFLGHSIRLIGLLHLIALKLHATRTWERAIQGKDYYDILALIQTNQVDTTSATFLAILDRYATPTIKERLLRDLQHPG